MKASVEEYNSENGYGSENVDVWTIFQGHSQNRFRAGLLRDRRFWRATTGPITIHLYSLARSVELSENTGASSACKP